MRFAFPRRSFRARLVGAAIVWVVLGTGAGWLALNEVFRRHILDEFTRELDHHAAELAVIVRVDPAGRPVLAQPLSDPRFYVPLGGQYWQVVAPSGLDLRSESMSGHRLPMAPAAVPTGEERAETVAGPSGTALLLERTYPASAVRPALRVAVAIDVAEIDDVLSTLRQRSAIALAALALGLIGGSVAQVTFGLAPLRRIGAALTAIRRGQARRLPDDLPSEIAPLSRGMNALIDANEDVVRRARVQAGNLAHALKTPLAILIDEAHRMRPDDPSATVIRRECEKMRRQIDYQLARARATAARDGATALAEVGRVLRLVVPALTRLHGPRGIAFELGEANLDRVAACESEDLEEILGNLLDNAGKWARGRVRVRVLPTTTDGREMLRFMIDDDGPGMPPGTRETVFEIGTRLDEQTAGSGLGLAIVRTVAGLYGGRVWIEDSDLGGASVRVELPQAAPEA